MRATREATFGAGIQTCRIEMLGTMRVVVGDIAITSFARQKSVALLAYLAISSRPQPREQLIELLWPEMEIEAGRDNLGTTFASLRRQLEPAGVNRGSILVATHTTIGLNSAAISTDVAEFDSSLDAAKAAGDTETSTALLKDAVSLYRGDFLPGVYYDWSVRESERLQARMIEAVAQLCRRLTERSQIDAALEAAQKWCGLDPYSEKAQLTLIGLFVAAGHAGQARRSYSQFTELFVREFGGPPSKQTVEAIEKLLSTRQTVEVPHQAVLRLPVAVPSPAQSVPPAKKASAIPAPLSRFFGREEELSALARLIATPQGTPDPAAPPEPAHRLVSIIGPGGVGKTRLVLEFARQLSARSDGWCEFVSLADVSEPGQVGAQIASAIKAPVPGSSSPIDAIISFLLEKDRIDAENALLLLDNIEQLLPEAVDGDTTAVTTIRTLLETIPNLTVLCTTRSPLRLRGERLFPLLPLAVPQLTTRATGHALRERLIGMPRVRLYVDRARCVRPDFDLTVSNAEPVAALCSYLGGIPLSIELAAGWVRSLPPRLMYERLIQGADIPAGAYVDLPQRQVNLWSVVDWSYRLLPLDLQYKLMQLSVFQGGWTADAFERVCGASDAAVDLERLVGSSLVSCTETAEGQPRYQMSRSVLAFSQDLAKNDEYITGVVVSLHAHYFLDLVRSAGTTGPNQARWFERFDAELENIRGALTWFERTSSVHACMELATRIGGYLVIHGRMEEAQNSLERALSLPESADFQIERARALRSLGNVHMRKADFEKAKAISYESARLFEALGDELGQELALKGVAASLLQQGRSVEAEPIYLQLLEINRRHNHTPGLAGNLNDLAIIAVGREDLDGALDMMQESLKFRRELADLQNVANTLCNLANLRCDQGEYAECEDNYKEALTTAREIGDVTHTIFALIGLSTIGSKRDRYEYAVTLLAGVHELFSSVSAPMSPHTSATKEALETEMKSKLGQKGFDTAWERGSGMELAEVVQVALSAASQKQTASERQAPN